jgi:hypothetical protein
MAKFNFPVSIEGLRKLFSTEEGRKLLSGLHTDDNVGYAISCLRQGWMSKMHHKENQMQNKAILDAVKKDPTLLERAEKAAAKG